MSAFRTLRTLRRGSDGEDVKRLQQFLTGAGFPCGLTDGEFGERTEQAVRQYQKVNGLVVDGSVGMKTWSAMFGQGIDFVRDVEMEWPPAPANLVPLTNNEARMRRWGRFDFRATPTASNPELIDITGDWEAKHLVQVTCPIFNKQRTFHKEVGDSFVAFMEDVKKAGLSHLILTWDGSFAPRFIRGSRSTLSNHAWATAFDINYEWNKLGATPAFKGQKGSVRELVPIANAHGWYWGGHFRRRDGMHFEKVG